MIRNTDSKSKFYYSFLAAIIIHAAIIAFVKKDARDFAFLNNLSDVTKNLKRPIKLDQIDFIKPEEVEKFRKVGIKNGKKDLQRPDLEFKQLAAPKLSGKAPLKKGSPRPLSLENLAPQLPRPTVIKKVTTTTNNNQIAKHFYFNYKQQKVIPPSSEQEVLKTEATKDFNAPVNKATQNISNFEIRYERPEGVSEDELNSDEKAYYSFYVRSYKNYYAKIYANYERIVVERPALSKVFDRKHILIGKIDYDENGNIVTVRILKSSDSDDLHYFFEETLKQLSQPNPPKVFTKNRKEFSIYYQLQIN